MASITEATMARIIIHGCFGKMGQAVAAAAAANPDMTVVAGVDTGSPGVKTAFPTFASLAECNIQADVVIDFSSPKALAGLLEEASRRKLPLIIATTGHTPEDKELIRRLSRELPIFLAANMSLGVNLLRELIQQAATVLGESFDIEIVEKHHNLKKDAPSGTALLLADALNEVFLNSRKYVFGRQTRTDLRQSAEIGIHAVRAGTIVGEHEVLFAGKDEVVEFRHAAYSRQIFAIGSIQAVRFLLGKPPGLYGMKEMITANSAVTRLYVSEEESLITLHRVPYDTAKIASVFRGLARENISVDMISQTAPVEGKVTISFTLPRSDVGKTERLFAPYDSEVEKDVVKVAVEGPGMETQSGVAARFFEVMAASSIGIHTVTTSETKIACLIAPKDAEKGVKAIKEAFRL
jgi:4-hydroxy-tetrahydrodipicolinate reductase